MCHSIIFSLTGMVMTMQRADQAQFGTMYEVVPMTAYTVRNKMSCFKSDGASEAPVSIQGVLPDLTGFQVLALRFSKVLVKKVNIIAVVCVDHLAEVWRKKGLLHCREKSVITQLMN